MCATLFFSTVTFALDLARFYVEMLNEENMVVSANLVMYLEILFFVFIGLTHLTADGLLVGSLGRVQNESLMRVCYQTGLAMLCDLDWTKLMDWSSAFSSLRSIGWYALSNHLYDLLPHRSR